MPLTGPMTLTSWGWEEVRRMVSVFTLQLSPFLPPALGQIPHGSACGPFEKHFAQTAVPGECDLALSRFSPPTLSCLTRKCKPRKGREEVALEFLEGPLLPRASFSCPVIPALGLTPVPDTFGGKPTGKFRCLPSSPRTLSKTFLSLTFISQKPVFLFAELLTKVLHQSPLSHIHVLWIRASSQAMLCSCSAVFYSRVSDHRC